MTDNFTVEDGVRFYWWAVSGVVTIGIIILVVVGLLYPESVTPPLIGPPPGTGQPWPFWMWAIL